MNEQLNQGLSPKSESLPATLSPCFTEIDNPQRFEVKDGVLTPVAVEQLVLKGDREAGEQWPKGLRNPFKKMLARIKSSDKALCKHSNKPMWEIHITWQDIERQFDRQQGRCYWLGIKLCADDAFSTKNVLIPSIDRLDNQRGYEVGNFVVTSRLANLGRGATPPAEFAAQIKKVRKMIANEMWPKFLFDELAQKTLTSLT